jgi:hypothetical protein
MSMCNVLGVLDDDEELMWDTLDAAIQLADAEHARLTLSKTCEPGRTYFWLCPFAAGGIYLPPAQDSPEEAGRVLARLAEFVPEWIPLTTLVLGANTSGELRKLVRKGQYGAIVAPESLLSRRSLLSRELRRSGIVSMPVSWRRGQTRQVGATAIVSPGELTTAAR